MSARPYTLLTGSTGLIGGHLLRELLERQIPVALLVRDSMTGDAKSKVEQLIAKLEESTEREYVRPRIITGDFAKPGLDVSEQDRAWIGRFCSRVLHNAAHLSFKSAAEHAHGEPYRTNVDGLVELVELCRGCEIAEFHHVSSAYVCGNRSGRILETDLNDGQSFSNDYEHSKLLGEELLRTYFENLTVYRPSIVIDPSLKLANLGDRTIYQAYSVYEYIAKMFGRPATGDLIAAVGMSGNERKNLVTAEWIASTIAHVLAGDTFHGRTFHLTHRQGTTIREIDEAFCQILEEKNIGRPRNGNMPLEKITQSAMSEQFIKTFAPYFRDDPVFDQTNVLEAFDGDISHLAPDVGVDSLRRLVVSDTETTASAPKQLHRKVRAAGQWQPFIDEFRVEKSSGHQLSGYRVGLLLHGLGGGDWLIGKAKDGRPVVSAGGAESADDVLSSSSSAWENWLNTKLPVDELMRSGEAMFERRQTTENDHQHEKLLCDFRRMFVQRSHQLVESKDRI